MPDVLGGGERSELEGDAEGGRGWGDGDVDGVGSLALGMLAILT